MDLFWGSCWEYTCDGLLGYGLSWWGTNLMCMLIMCLLIKFLEALQVRLDYKVAPSCVTFVVVGALLLVGVALHVESLYLRLDSKQRPRVRHELLWAHCGLCCMWRRCSYTWIGSNALAFGMSCCGRIEAGLDCVCGRCSYAWIESNALVFPISCCRRIVAGRAHCGW
jgi:hypothetical protein